jgi:hypothetical protein
MVYAGVRELSAAKNITNNKGGQRVVGHYPKVVHNMELCGQKWNTIVTWHSTQKTGDRTTVQTQRGACSTTSCSASSHRSGGMEATIVKLILVVMAVAVGTLVATITTLVTTEIGLCWDVARWAEGIDSSNGWGSRGEIVSMDRREVLCRNS